MPETQLTISTWANETFGKVTDLKHAFRRSQEEITELDIEMTCDNPDPVRVINEMADVVITFYRCAAVMGQSLDRAISHKMSVNRSRKWTSDGTGHGYHLKEKDL